MLNSKVSRKNFSKAATSSQHPRVLTLISTQILNYIKNLSILLNLSTPPYFLSFYLLLIYIYVYVCASLCGGATYICRYLPRPEEGFGSLEPELQVVVSPLLRMLGTALGSSARAASTPSWYAISLAQSLSFEELDFLKPSFCLTSDQVRTFIYISWVLPYADFGM